MVFSRSSKIHNRSIQPQDKVNNDEKCHVLPPLKSHKRPKQIFHFLPLNKYLAEHITIPIFLQDSGVLAPPMSQLCFWLPTLPWPDGFPRWRMRYAESRLRFRNRKGRAKEMARSHIHPARLHELYYFVVPQLGPPHL